MIAVVRRLPEVPVMVKVDAPGAAELLAMRVSELVPVVLEGLMEALTPEGRPKAARLTMASKPFCGVIAIVLVTEPPGATLTFAGVAERTNAGAPLIVKVSRAVPASVPEAPVIVMIDVDATAELLARKVNVLVVMALGGLNEAVTPAGNPPIVRLTALEKPCCALTVMVATPLAPAATETVDADADKLNAGALEAPVRLLISGWPEGLPHPVARS
jgi:hypothetical protein